MGHRNDPANTFTKQFHHAFTLFFIFVTLVLYASPPGCFLTATEDGQEQLVVKLLFKAY